MAIVIIGNLPVGQWFMGLSEMSGFWAVQVAVKQEHAHVVRAEGNTPATSIWLILGPQFFVNFWKILLKFVAL